MKSKPRRKGQQLIRIAQDRAMPKANHTWFDAALRLDGVTSMRAALLAGAGVGVMPHFAVREAVAEGTLQLLLGDWRIPPVAYHAVYPASRFVPAKVRTFVDLCVQEMPGRFDEIR